MCHDDESEYEHQLSFSINLRNQNRNCVNAKFSVDPTYFASFIGISEFVFALLFDFCVNMTFYVDHDVTFAVL